MERNAPDGTGTTPIRTHAEVAREMTRRGYPMTRSRVHQLEESAMKKIRLIMQRHHLDFEHLDPNQAET